MSLRTLTNVIIFPVYVTWMISTCYLANAVQKICRQETAFSDIHGALTWWLCLSFVVLFDLLCILDYRTKKRVDEEPLGRKRRPTASDLFAGFLLALPAVIITGLGFVTAFPHFLEALNPKGSKIQLIPDPEKARHTSKGILYLIAVDVSKSALPKLKSEELKAVKLFTHRLFEKGPENAEPIVKSNDRYEIYFFAGEQEFLTSNLGSPNPHTPTNRMLEQFDQQIEIYRNPGKDKQIKIKADYTNLLAMLDTLEYRAEVDSKNYDAVTVIIFSDFLHDPEHADPRGTIESNLRGIMEKARGCGNVQIIGVKMEDMDRTEHPESTGDANKDIRPFLNMFGEGFWRELSLQEYANATEDKRSSTLIFGIYREKKVDKPLYLKYLLNPRWHAIASTIEFPKDGTKDFDRVRFDLTTSQDGDGALSKVKVAFGSIADPFVLGVGVGKPSSDNLLRTQSTQEPLELRLDSALDVSRSAECDLRIAIPARSEVRSLRLVIIPVLGEAAMEIFKYSLYFLAGAGIILALRIAGAPLLHWLITKWTSFKPTGGVTP